MLLLDAGNSRIKWAFAQNGDWLSRGANPVSDESALRQSLAQLPAPERILVSNVAGEAAAQLIRSACAAWSCRVEFITAKAEQCGVRNAYDQPEKLGSDRWAALIGAWQQIRAACLVVSCGTATTVDALSDSGEFLGGLIVPGLEMMQDSLAAGTAQLTRSGGNWRDFPRNTADAIFSGAVKATAGAVLQQHTLLGRPGAPCLLGGGAAGLVRPHLNLPLQNGDDLVLQGLQLIGQGSGKND